MICSAAFLARVHKFRSFYALRFDLIVFIMLCFISCYLGGHFYSLYRRASRSKLGFLFYITRELL